MVGGGEEGRQRKRAGLICICEKAHTQAVGGRQRPSKRRQRGKKQKGRHGTGKAQNRTKTYKTQKYTQGIKARHHAARCVREAPEPCVPAVSAA